MKVLVTGAAGSIGRVTTVGLADRGHTVVGLDRVPQPEGDDGSWYTVDATDADAVAAVFEEERLDAVVHLAGHPGEANLPDSLTSHVVTTAALLDAMVEHDVRRFVYAGSNHAVGRTPRARPGRHRRPARGRTRSTASARSPRRRVMSLYVDRYGIDAVVLPDRLVPASGPSRSATCPPGSRHDDCVRMFEAALTATAPGFAVLYGISANTRAWWDLEPGRALGYEPQDDAEEFAGLDRSPSPDDEAEAAHVGGPYATAESSARRSTARLDLECTPTLTLAAMSLTIAEAADAHRPDPRHAALLRARRADAAAGRPVGDRPPALHRAATCAGSSCSTACAAPACRSATYAAYADLVRAGDGNEQERLDLLRAHRRTVLAQLAEVPGAPRRDRPQDRHLHRQAIGDRGA